MISQRRPCDAALSLAERIEIDLAEPRQDHRALKLACRWMPVRENATAPACSRASPAFGHDWTQNLMGVTRLQVAFRITIKCDDDMIGDWQFQAGFKLSAEDLPVRLSETTSYAIFCPSFSSRMPARSTALMCTKTSAPPASG